MRRPSAVPAVLGTAAALTAAGCSDAASAPITGAWVRRSHQHRRTSPAPASANTPSVTRLSPTAMRHLVGDRRRLYASDMGTAYVYVVDLASAKARRLAKIDDHPDTVDLSPDGKVLYVSCRGRNNPRSYYIPGPERGLSGRT